MINKKLKCLLYGFKTGSDERITSPDILLRVDAPSLRIF